MSLEDDRRLLYHLRVAEIMGKDAESVLSTARENLARWLSSDPDSKPYYREWEALLGRLDPGELAQLIVEDSEDGCRLRNSSPFIGVLSEKERDHIFSSADPLHPLAKALARGVDRRERLIKDAGRLLQLEDAAERLGLPPHTLTEQRLQKAVLAVQAEGGEWRFPACQFDEDGLIDGIGEFVRSFRDAEPWTHLVVLLAPSLRYANRSAIELLKAGEIAAACSISGTWGDMG